MNHFAHVDVVLKEEERLAFRGRRSFRSCCGGAGDGWRGGSRRVSLFKCVVAVLFFFLSRTQSTPSCVCEVTHELPDACLSFFLFLCCLPVEAVHRVTHRTSDMSALAEGQTSRLRHRGAQQPPLLATQTLF